MSLYVKIKKKLGAFGLDVEFEAEAGVMALLGASGSGKSMTLKCVAGVETPDSGRIALDDRVLFDSEERINLSPQKRSVGYLFQNYALFPNMTASQNIMAGIKGDKRLRHEKAREKISAMQLGGLEDKYPHQLSGGQQQRVALARILASEPEVILLDEPLSALDSYLKWQLELTLKDTLAQFGGTAVFVSHSRDEVYRLCERVCVIDAGKSEPTITVPQLFDRPATVSAALLSGCKNYSRAELCDDGTVSALDWGTKLHESYIPEGDFAFIGVRAHYIKIAEEQGENVIQCHVDRVIEEVFETTLMLNPLAGKADSSYNNIRLAISKEKWQALSNPEQLDIYIDPSAIMLLR